MKDNNNKPQSVRIQQAFESLKVAIKTYLKTRDEEIAKIIIESTKNLNKEILKDLQSFPYISSLKEGRE